MGRIMLFTSLTLIAAAAAACIASAVTNKRRKKAIRAGKMAGLCRDCDYFENFDKGRVCWSPLIKENRTSDKPVSKPCDFIRGTDECQFKEKENRDGRA